MSDHPILFSAPMVRALLDGRKTQARRVLKPQPVTDANGLVWWYWSKSSGSAMSPPGSIDPDWVTHLRWAPGDTLWVREGWASGPTLAYRCSSMPQTVNPSDPTETAIYREGFGHSTCGIRWRPSIHMPRWASRITLAVEAVRVERLQDISEGDAIAEGILLGHPDIVAAHGPCFHAGTGDLDVEWSPDPTDAFIGLWDSIHGADAWNANPWVSVTTFRRVEP